MTSLPAPDPRPSPAASRAGGQGPSDAPADVAAFVRAGPRHDAFLARPSDLVAPLLPARRDEGKAPLAIGPGRAGGPHRSVAVAEALSEALAKGGWRVSKRQRELERRAGGGGLAASGTVS